MSVIIRNKEKIMKHYIYYYILPAVLGVSECTIHERSKSKFYQVLSCDWIQPGGVLLVEVCSTDCHFHYNLEK